MKLAALLKAIAPVAVSGTLDRDVQAISYDSRHIVADALFVALPGEKVDGTQFINAAIDKAKKPQLSGPGFKVGDQQFQFPMPAFGTKDQAAKEAEDAKLATDRAAQDKGDKPYDPTSELIDRKLHGAPPKSKEQRRIEDHLTQSIEAGKDAGVAGVVRKRHE